MLATLHFVCLSVSTRRVTVLKIVAIQDLANMVFFLTSLMWPRENGFREDDKKIEMKDH